ncbi:tRNA:m(4)X modification enzyme TRM13 homolog [Prorops nasuta]|uniref:tRNA:m(4)X modification enzyme TRM13 homolog n=1 Tax=Prorops nasuta TaxID=863751 RepID=UPI0034CD9804
MTQVPQCAFFVERKKRFCRMSVKDGKKFCGEHELFNSNTDNNINSNQKDKRIRCPLDPSHTCYELKLSKHLKVCNTKHLLNAKSDFIIKSINIEKNLTDKPQHIPLSQLDKSLVNTIINKINIAYEKLPEVTNAILQHKVLNNEINKEIYGKNAVKHLLQNSSLLAHLEQAGLIRDKTCFIEFGAGRGKLTYWLAQAIKDKTDSSILLVDRSSHRHKYDNKLKNEYCPITVKRVKADIADLNLFGLTEIQMARHKVGIAKHLCGAATDLTLKCLTQKIAKNSKSNSDGLVIAFCCHHRCDYTSYVGKKFFEQCNFTANEFPILCSIASWATCGTGLSKPLHNAEEYKKFDNNENDNTINMDETEREIIGRKVKLLLNWGRIEYLKDYGFQSKLYHYVSTAVSLENMCIVAKGA